MKNHLLALLFVWACPAISFATETKDWNFLIYLNGVNNLDSFGKSNINQMEETGSTDRINVLVQWGSLSRASVDRLYIQKDADAEKVTSPVEQSLGPVDMGSSKSIVDFVRWAQTNHPARHTFLVVWDHGSGWHRPEFAGPIIKDISLDERTGHIIRTEDLGRALREIKGILGKNVDIYGSDACLMGMAEVADEMSTAVDYFVGSQDLEPADGWPYAPFLRQWAADADQSPAEIARLLSREYLAAYSGGVFGQSSVTMSAYDMSRLGAFKSAVKALGTRISSLPSATLSSIQDAISQSKSFTSEDYRDVLDFVDQARLDSLAPAESAALRAAHKDLVIANDQNQDQKTYGLSMWLPIDKPSYSLYANRYRGMAFHRATGWGTTLQKILKK